MSCIPQKNDFSEFVFYKRYANFTLSGNSKKKERFFPKATQILCCPETEKEKIFTKATPISRCPETEKKSFLGQRHKFQGVRKSGKVRKLHAVQKLEKKERFFWPLHKFHVVQKQKKILSGRGCAYVCNFFFCIFCGYYNLEQPCATMWRLLHLFMGGKEESQNQSFDLKNKLSLFASAFVNTRNFVLLYLL